MAQHIIVGSGSPLVAPNALGQHYVDTLNGAVYMAAGISSIADWKPSTTLSNEQLQDVIGPMFDNTAVSPITTIYDDSNNKVVISLDQSQIDHNQLSNRGTNTHAQIDAHISSISNPHAVTKAQVGLGNCDNTSDLNKPISNLTQTALNNKENLISAGTITQYWRGDKTWQTLDKNAVGLNNVDNTSDLNKPISNLTQTALNNKSDSNHIHSLATISSDGFMSGSDKAKLDGLTNSVFPKTNTSLNNSSQTTYTNISELEINCIAGKVYKFKYYLRHISNATGTGITFSINGTASGSIGAKALMSTSRTATSIPSLNSFAGALAITGVPSTSPELSIIEGIFVCTGNGTMYPQFRSELNGNQVQLLDNSIMEYNEI